MSDRLAVVLWWFIELYSWSRFFLWADGRTDGRTKVIQEVLADLKTCKDALTGKLVATFERSANQNQAWCSNGHADLPLIKWRKKSTKKWQQKSWGGRWCCSWVWLTGRCSKSPPTSLTAANQLCTVEKSAEQSGVEALTANLLSDLISVMSSSYPRVTLRFALPCYALLCPPPTRASLCLALRCTALLFQYSLSQKFSVLCNVHKPLLLKSCKIFCSCSLSFIPGPPTTFVVQ